MMYNLSIDVFKLIEFSYLRWYDPILSPFQKRVFNLLNCLNFVGIRYECHFLLAGDMLILLVLIRGENQLHALA